MKNIKILSILLLMLLIFTGCNQKEKYLIEISYDEFKEKIENKETFFIEVMQDSCSYCQVFTPKLEEVLNEYKITGYKLNISTMSEEEYNEFSLAFGKDGTPTTIFLTEGKELSKMQRIQGNVSKQKIITKLKGNGYIER